MRVIDLNIELNFIEAIQYLLDGRCIGIRPKGNSNFLVKYKPDWMNKKSPDFTLCWNRTVKDGKGNQDVRTDQYMGVWSPVVIDVNNLPETVTDLFLLENITHLKNV